MREIARLREGDSKIERFRVCGYILLCSGLGIVGNRWFKCGGNRETWLSSTRVSWARVPSLFFKFRCQRQVPRWNRKMGYSSSPSSSTTKSGTFLYISQTVFWA